MRVISAPHDGPTVVTLTSLMLAPVSSTRAWRTSSTASVPSMSERTLMVSVPTIWILAPAAPVSLKPSRASATDTPGAGTSHAVPPANSMPKSRPRSPKLAVLTSSAASEPISAGFHSFGKSISCSPRNSLPSPARMRLIEPPSGNRPRAGSSNRLRRANREPRPGSLGRLRD